MDYGPFSFFPMNIKNLQQIDETESATGYRIECKYVVFMGDIKNSKYKSDWIQKIKDLTHWSTKKVVRRSTRE
jgi:hypothetical protein